MKQVTKYKVDTKINQKPLTNYVLVLVVIRQIPVYFFTTKNIPLDH